MLFLPRVLPDLRLPLTLEFWFAHSQCMQSSAPCIQPAHRSILKDERWSWHLLPQYPQYCATKQESHLVHPQHINPSFAVRLRLTKIKIILGIRRLTSRKERATRGSAQTERKTRCLHAFIRVVAGSLPEILVRIKSRVSSTPTVLQMHYLHVLKEPPVLGTSDAKFLETNQGWTVSRLVRPPQSSMQQRRLEQFHQTPQPQCQLPPTPSLVSSEFLHYNCIRTAVKTTKARDVGIHLWTDRASIGSSPKFDPLLAKIPLHDKYILLVSRSFPKVCFLFGYMDTEFWQNRSSARSDQGRHPLVGLARFKFEDNWTSAQDGQHVPQAPDALSLGGR